MKSAIDEKSALRRRLFRHGYTVGLVSLLFIGGVAFQSARNYFTLTDWVLHTNDVLHQLRVLDNVVETTQMALDDYAHFRREVSITTFRAQMQRQQTELNRLADLVAAHEALAPLEKVKLAFQTAYAQLDDTILELPKQRGNPTYSHTLLLNGLRTQIKALEAAERRILIARTNIAREAASLTFRVIGIASALAFMVLVLARLQMLRDMRELNSKHEEFERARQAAETASRSKSEFLANMSHEIRTPMNAVIGMTSLLLRSNPRPDQREYCETIQRSGQALLRIIQDVLDLSRVEAGKLALEENRLDPRLLLHHVADMISLSVAAPVRVGVSIDDRIPTALFGDAGRLQQVLLNIAGNAAKFTDNGSIQLSASIEHITDNFATIRFEVTDTGIGIPPASRDRLFQPFSQVTPGAPRERLGTGLGLSICKRLVETMGGSIGVESEVGRGSRFYFSIPLSLKEADPSSFELFEEINNDPMQFTGRALVVDDNPANLIVAVRLLEAMGLAAFTAESGEEAVEEALDGTYDLIFMDCQMPGVDGFLATAQIRERERSLKRSPTPIIALTAYASREVAQRCLEAGMDDFIHKPIDFDQLNVTIGRFLTPATSNAANEHSAEAPATDSGVAPYAASNELSLLEQTDPVDFTMLMRLHELPVKLGNPNPSAMVEQLIGLFEQGRDRAQETLKTHVRYGDAKAFAEAAHFFKSSGSSVGAKRVVALLASLEQSRESGVIPPDVDSRLEALADEWNIALASIHAWWDGRKVVEHKSDRAEEA